MHDLIPEIEQYLAEQAGADTAKVQKHSLMSGGAIQENWLLDVNFEGGPIDGVLQAVLRLDSPSILAESLSRAQEFALLQTAFNAGVTVPEPLFLCENPDDGPLGTPFFVMRRVQGIAAGFKIVRDERLGGGRKNLARQLGQELARIHSIKPPVASLDFLKLPETDPAQVLIDKFTAYLDNYHTPRPSLYWGLDWLQKHKPVNDDLVLCHNDYRTGNYMVTPEKVTGILDWEFAAWGDPLEDIGWFCARCWRFGADDREAGGIGSREDFYTGYEQESGHTINRLQVPYWEVIETMRWSIIALQQCERHVSGNELNLELALTGQIVPELEMDILQMTKEAR